MKLLPPFVAGLPVLISLGMAQGSGGARGGSEAGSPASAGPAAPSNITQLSLEQLLDIEVTSVGRKEEKRSMTASAIDVLSGEDLRRSGATSIPEALRLSPGLEVARVDAHNWAVTARGFNGIFANKLLVLVDGRTVYSPVFSGVYWDVQDLMLEDLDRVEVLRGPGAAMWGANAVNGVISVTSKAAEETQGLLVTGGGGTEERGFAGVRYGGRLATNAAYRVYGKWFERDDSAYANGADGQDAWRMFRGGFRSDWHPGEDNLVTFQGDLYGGRVEQVFTVTSPVLLPNGQFSTNQFLPYDIMGGNLVGRWTHNFSDRSSVQVQGYYDRTQRRMDVELQEHDTFDVDAQHRFQAGERHDLVWGLGYRFIRDDLTGTYTMNFVPPQRDLQLFSAFVQDEIALVEERLNFTLGTRLEHNDFTGFEVQPNARLFWRAGGGHGLWGAVSRAVRTPSRAESDGLVHQPGPFFPLVTELRGNPDYQSETLMAYELGHRWQPHARVAFETALFYHAYDDLRSLEPGLPEPGFPTILPVEAANLARGDAWGIEFGPRYRATDWWSLEAAYTFLELDLELDPASRDVASVQDEGRVPQHQFSLRSHMDFGSHWELDATLRFVDELPDFPIEQYLAMDLRIAWKPTRNLELALVGQNLFDDRHPEYASTLLGTQSTEVERSVYARVTLRY